MAWLNLTMHNQAVKNGLKAKKIKLPQMIFYMYLLAPFILQNFKKILRIDPELWGCAIFGLKMTICPEQIFWVQTIIVTFIYLMALFIAQNFKKILLQIQNYEDAPFLDPKWSIFPKQIFLENY